MPPLRLSAWSSRARTRIVGTVALTVLVAVGAACQQQAVKKGAPPPPPPPPSQYCHPSTPTSASGYQAAFDGMRAVNAGLFVAADGGIPIPLGDGRILWFFGDTVLGRWTPGGPVDPFWGLDNNAFVLQTGNCFTPRREPIPDPAPNEWIWPTGAVVENGVLRVLGLHMKKTGSGPLDFSFIRMEVANFSLPGLAFMGFNSLPVPTSPDYGLTVFSDGTNVYAYGRVKQGFGFHHYVARVPVGSLLTGSAWEYWHDDHPDADPPLLLDGVGVWKTAAQTDPQDADPIWFDPPDPPSGDPALPGPDKGPGAGFPVAKTGPSSYLGSALGVDFIADADLLTWHATLPEGPWIQDVTVAVNVPPNGGGMHTYGGRVVLGLPNVPIALWSQNHDSFDAVLADPNRYKVLFATPNRQSLNPDPPPPGP